MQNLLEELKADKDMKKMEQWSVQFERELERLDDGERNFYLLLLSEVYAVKMRNLDKAHQCLKKVELNNDLIIYEHRLRLCYFRFLEGDYDEAINDLNLIKVTIDNSLHSRNIATHFFRRIIWRRQSEILDEDRPQNTQNKKEDYQFDLINALKFERNNNIEGAKRSHIAIYNNYGDISPSIKYQAAKHILLLQGRSKNKVANQKQYETVVTAFEKGLNNKEYYYKKIQFLQLVIEILQESESEEVPINHKIINIYVIDMIDKNIAIIKDNPTKIKLKQLRNDLQSHTQLNQQICYNFLGDKVYKQLIKFQNQQKSKISKPKQSSIKVPKIQSQYERPKDKMKQTQSIMQKRQFDDDFRGSYMTKINMNSGGYEQRYFYIKDDFVRSRKLYYCNKKGKQDDASDDFYRLKGFKKIQFGKKSKALQRKQCEQFDEGHCFTLKIDGEDIYERNFYVREEEDLNNWIALFQILMEERNTSNIKKTVMI